MKENTDQFNAIKNTMAAYGEMAGSLSHATMSSTAFENSVAGLTEALDLQKSTI